MTVCGTGYGMRGFQHQLRWPPSTWNFLFFIFHVVRPWTASESASSLQRSTWNLWPIFYCYSLLSSFFGRSSPFQLRPEPKRTPITGLKASSNWSSVQGLELLTVTKGFCCQSWRSHAGRPRWGSDPGEKKKFSGPTARRKVTKQSRYLTQDGRWPQVSSSPNHICTNEKDKNICSSRAQAPLRNAGRLKFVLASHPPSSRREERDLEDLEVDGRILV